MSWWEEFEKNIPLAKCEETVIHNLLKNISVKKARDREENGLLHYVAKTNNKFLANYLIEAGCDLNLKNRDGETPLMVAIKCNQVVMVRLLVNAGANLEEVNEDDHTPLQISLLHYGGTKKKQIFKIIKILVKAGSNVNKIYLNYENETLVHYAVRNEYHDVLDLLLKAGAGVDTENVDGLTPLYYAIEYNDYDSAKKLINAGAEVYYVRHLCKAAVFFRADILELLLDKGVNAINSNGLNVLQVCLSSNLAFLVSESYQSMIPDILKSFKTKQNVRCVQILLDHGANPLIYCDSIASPLNIAILSYYNSVTIPIREGPLKSASDMGLNKIIRLLIEYGATLDYNCEIDFKVHNVKKNQLKFYKEILEDDDFDNDIKEGLKNFHSKCLEELKEMKDVDIHKSSVTLFKLTLKTNLKSYLKNKNVVNVLKSNKKYITKHYPIYGPDIFENLDDELRKQSLLTKASQGLSKIFNLNDYSLPAIFEKILSFLHKRELNNLASLA